MKRANYLGMIFLALSTPQCFGQQAASQGNGSRIETDVSMLRQRSREDEVARVIDEVRANSGLSQLKRLRSSDWDLRLTCTSAVEKRAIDDWVGLKIFEVQTPEELTANIAFSELISKEAGKELPKYSVTVFRDPDSSPQKPTLVVGILLQESWSDRLKGCLFTEDGCNYSYAFKGIVAPACRNMR